MRAGIAEIPGDYPWSSDRSNALGVADTVVFP